MDLDPFPTELLDGEDRDVVAGNKAKRSDDEVADADAEEPVPRRAIAAVEANLLEDDVLVQVDAIEPAQSRRVSPPSSNGETR